MHLSSNRLKPLRLPPLPSRTSQTTRHRLMHRQTPTAGPTQRTSLRAAVNREKKSHGRKPMSEGRSGL